VRFDAITLFPEMFDAVLDYGITGGRWIAVCIGSSHGNPRDFTDDPHRTVDDRPTAAARHADAGRTLDRALNAAKQDLADENLTPGGAFSPGPSAYPPAGDGIEDAVLKQKSRTGLVCGRYEA